MNILVLDTELYSNTGGQKSKATPLGAVCKFAAAGARRNKKDLGLLAMQYGDVYVASIALGANMTQALHAFQEAEAYPVCSSLLSPLLSFSIQLFWLSGHLHNRRILSLYLTWKPALLDCRS